LKVTPQKDEWLEHVCMNVLRTVGGVEEMVVGGDRTSVP
jgi:hypothetical protein